MSEQRQRFLEDYLLKYLSISELAERCSGSYTPEGYKGLMEEGGSKRIEAAKQALGSVGGSLEAFIFLR